VSKVNVFAPSSNNRVRLNACVPILFEEAEKRLPHLGQREAPLSCWVIDESVESAFVRAGFAAGFLILVLGPEPFTAFWTMLANEAFLLEEWEIVSFRRERFILH
jgi:hypothetical protein